MAVQAIARLQRAASQPATFHGSSRDAQRNQTVGRAATCYGGKRENSQFICATLKQSRAKACPCRKSSNKESISTDDITDGWGGHPCEQGCFVQNIKCTSRRMSAVAGSENLTAQWEICGSPAGRRRKELSLTTSTPAATLIFKAAANL